MTEPKRLITLAAARTADGLIHDQAPQGSLLRCGAQTKIVKEMHGDSVEVTCSSCIAEAWRGFGQ